MSGQIIYRSGNRYAQEEKMAIVKDYLESNLSRNAIVKKYRIGQGTLIAWLRIFGVEKNILSTDLSPPYPLSPVRMDTPSKVFE